MPNHVENDLRITGSKEDLDKFKRFATNGENLLDVNKFIPYPEEFIKLDKEIRLYDKERDNYIAQLKKDGEDINKAWEKYPYKKDGYNSGGYEWCIKNWGTKWGMYNVVLEETHDEYTDELFYIFQSAWNPPIPVIKKMQNYFLHLILN